MFYGRETFTVFRPFYVFILRVVVIFAWIY